jgi:hydrogenase maturation protease
MATAKVAEKQILVAAVGNLWMRDDGFGSAVARRLREGDVPSGVSIADFGSSGLDLAYEVMRGYDALVLVDVSRQGGEPGTLYVMEAREEDIAAGIEDGAMVDPHGMDPETVLRFVRAVGGWPGKVMVIACEPANVEEPGMGLTPEVAATVDRAVDLVADTVLELQSDAAYAS